MMVRMVTQSSNLGTRGQGMLSSTGRVILSSFYFLDPINRFAKPQYYTYKLIETLLPKAMVDLKKSPNLKMIELYV